MVLSDIDRRLLERCLNGAAGAWEDFVDRYIALITHVASSTASNYSIGLTPQTRDDIVADVFLSLIQNDYAVLRRFRGQSSLGTYLVVISRRIIVRRLARQKLTSTETLKTEPAAAPEVAELEINDQIQSLLSRIPVSEATAIRMFHIEERSYREIGMHIGIPENSVGPLLTKARTRLRELQQ